MANDIATLIGLIVAVFGWILAVFAVFRALDWYHSTIEFLESDDNDNDNDNDGDDSP